MGEMLTYRDAAMCRERHHMPPMLATLKVHLGRTTRSFTVVYRSIEPLHVTTTAHFAMPTAHYEQAILMTKVVMMISFLAEVDKMR